MQSAESPRIRGANLCVLSSKKTDWEQNTKHQWHSDKDQIQSKIYDCETEILKKTD